MRVAILLTVLASTLPLAGPAGAGEPVTILRPPPGAVVRGGGIAAFVVAGEGSLAARLNDSPLPPPTDAGSVQHWVVRLRPGKNVFSVGPTGGPAAATREVVFAAPFFDEEQIPRGFAARPFHGDETVGPVCRECHELAASRSAM